MHSSNFVNLLLLTKVGHMHLAVFSIMEMFEKAGVVESATYLHVHIELHKALASRLTNRRKLRSEN